MKNFALIGAAGYVASRHMRAIKETGHNLVALLDKNDSVGIIDSYFPDAAFFTEFERFDRYLTKLIRNGTKIDYISVCSPNYLHDSHILFGLRIGADVICEKPLVLNPWNLDGLYEAENDFEGKVYTILQLRLHPAIIALKEKIDAQPDRIYDIDLTYITSRGKWYYSSWKGIKEKSGGIATNIGIHFFDMLQWIFGDVVENKVHVHTHDRAAGFLKLQRANVNWFLSINSDTLPEKIKEQGIRTFRSIQIDNEEIEFSNGFTDLHKLSYEDILAGKGFGLDDASKAVKIVYDIRNAPIVPLNGHHHKMASTPIIKHPFEKNLALKSSL